MPRAPVSSSRGMEQLRGAAKGAESPREREERGESGVSSRPPLSKSSRLDVNSSPAAPGNSPNGTPLRPLGGGGRLRKMGSFVVVGGGGCFCFET